MTAETDEDRWAEAQSLLDRTPTQAAEQRFRRSRRNRRLLVLGLLVGINAVALLLTFVLLDGGVLDEKTDVPTWRAVLGFTLSGVGLLWAAIAVIAQVRGTRRVGGFRSPALRLTRRQRKELLEQARGRTPLIPERLPLVRHVAELTLLQRLAVLPQFGLLANFVGLWIADPTPWRLVMAATFAVVLVTAGLVYRREGRRMRGFLDTHPA